MVSRDTLLLESKMAQARRKVYVVGVGMTKVLACTMRITCSSTRV